MIMQAVLYVAAFTCNCVLVTGSIRSPLMKVDPGTTLDLYKSVGRSVGANDYDYAIVKRGPQDAQESPDSKERRSQMGSSFIRFGRGRMEDNNPDNLDYSSMVGDAAGGNELDSRMARGRSDVIIRFGRNDLSNSRSGVSSLSRQFPRSDSAKFHEPAIGAERPGKFAGGANFENDRVAIVCANLIGGSNDGAASVPVNYYLAGKLLRLCKSLGLENDIGDEKDRRAVRSKIIDVLEDAVFQAEYVKQK